MGQIWCCQDLASSSPARLTGCTGFGVLGLEVPLGGSHRRTCVSDLPTLHGRLDAAQPFVVAGGQQAAFQTSSAHIHVCTQTCGKGVLQSILSTDAFYFSSIFRAMAHSHKVCFTFNFIKRLLLLPIFKTAAPLADDLRIFPFVAKH